MLEVDPQLLRYVRPAGKGSSDPDESDVLEDRLLVEALHGVFRATRSRTEKRAVTSDVMLARILHAEGIPTLFLQVPQLPADAIPCLHYEPLAQEFVGAPLVDVLWDLTHLFGTIRLKDDTGNDCVRLQAYWTEKNVADWNNERLQVSRPSEMPSQRLNDQSGKTNPGVRSLPEASFLHALRLGGALLEGANTLDTLMRRTPVLARPTKPMARQAIDFLVQSGFAQAENEHFQATTRLGELDEMLAVSDLDAANQLWLQFAPYKTLVDGLKQKSELRIDTLPELLAAALERRPSKESCERFARIAVYLGQAWIQSSLLKDGTARSPDQVVANVFTQIFEAQGQDGICQLTRILPLLCQRLRYSPWAIASQLRHLIATNYLPTFSFQPSAGKRIPAQNHVVHGHLRDLKTLSVPLDRLDVGGQPVFAVSRRSS